MGKLFPNPQIRFKSFVWFLYLQQKKTHEQTKSPKLYYKVPILGLKTQEIFQRANFFNLCSSFWTKCGSEGETKKRLFCPHSRKKERFKLVIILLQNEITDFRLCFCNRTSAISGKDLISSPEMVSKKSCTVTFCKNCCIEMIFKEILKKGKLQHSVLQVIKSCIPA